ncbi:autotransporter outer membrane beta-barrel domain-containing protein [Mucilaginibacter lutimaris]|uniref:Autotransporter outer membrane beta-barrel domain-containing protein n=1 Tax=Mucilaginibacter lutimaris TaxID=931629 RepID=A0ABW2ZL08_9SPHI
MYKKLLLVCVSAITIHTAKAQTEKGSQMIGASFGFSTSTSNFKTFDASINALGPTQHSKFTTYNIGPDYSYFIADNLDLGAGVSYGYSKQENEAGFTFPNEQRSRAFNAGLYLRKYVLFENKIGIRTGPYLNYNMTKLTAFDSGNPSYYNNTNKTYSGGIGLDFVYFPVKKLALAARMGNINYSHQKMEGYTEGTSNGFNASFVNGVNFSVNYVF